MIGALIGLLFPAGAGVPALPIGFVPGERMHVVDREIRLLAVTAEDRVLVPGREIRGLRIDGEARSLRTDTERTT